MTFMRVPETAIIMTEAESVAAFYDAGQCNGPLSPIYQFSCRALSRLLPIGGVVLDIGCGPGQFLARLLQYRSDLTGIGTDMSSRMLQTAGRRAVEAAIADRVNYIHADFINVDQAITESVDAIVCMSALHHCPDFASLTQSLSAIKRLRDRQRSAIWLFDLVRPESADLCELIPRTHEVSCGESLPDAFKRDWVNSLKAGWTFDEFKQALIEADLQLHSTTASFSQLHWMGEHHDGQDVIIDNLALDRSDSLKADRLASNLGLAHLNHSSK